MSIAVTQEYIDELQKKIFSIIAPIIHFSLRESSSNEEPKYDVVHVDALLDSVALNEYWVKAFTHESFDPVNNYQTLEFFGDEIMNYCFAEYIRKLAKKQDYPLTQAKASLVLNYYMSEAQQAKLARDLGLVEYVRFDPEYPNVNIKVQEDVVEAFFGALNILCNDRISDGMGPMYCLALITELFDPVKIDFDKIQKDSVTQLKELYEKLGWGNKPNYVVTPTDQPARGDVKVEVRTAQGDVLGIGYGPKKKNANLEAAENALETLRQRGITAETADQGKVQRRREHDPEFDLQYRRVELAIKKLNEVARSQRKVQATEFKIRQIESHQSEGVSRTTFAIEAAYPQPNGTVIWHRLSSLTGTDKDQTKITLMKNFAKTYRIPERV